MSLLLNERKNNSSNASSLNASYRKQSLTNMLNISGRDMNPPEDGNGSMKNPVLPKKVFAFRQFKISDAIPKRSVNLSQRAKGSAENPNDFDDYAFGSRANWNAYGQKNISTKSGVMSPSSTASRKVKSPESMFRLSRDVTMYNTLKSQKAMLLSDANLLNPIDNANFTADPNKFFLSRNRPNTHSNLVKQYNSYDKLPLKRQALNKNLRQDYSSIIKAKEVGTIDVTKYFPKSRQKKGSILSKTPAPEIDKDDEVLLIENIGNKIFNSFKNKLELYNRYYSSHLMEPDKKYTSMKDLHLSSRNLTSSPQPRVLDLNTRHYIRNRTQTFLPKERLDPNINRDGATSPSNQNTKYTLSMQENAKIKKLLDSIEGSKAAIDKEEKQIDTVEKDRNKLNGIGVEMDRAKPLSSREAVFLKYVKEGADSEVDLMLFESRTLVNVRDLMNETPMHWAAKRGYERIVNLLYEYGADIFAKDLAGRKPKDVAQLNGHKALATWFAYEEEKVKKSKKQIAVKLHDPKDSREYEQEKDLNHTGQTSQEES